jgi:hypothetical protein
MKLKCFCKAKEIVSKLKRPPSEWEKNLDSYTSDKQIIQGVQKTEIPQNQKTNKEVGN